MKMSLQEKKTNKRRCCVSECKSHEGETNSLHRFPLRDKNLYGKWLKILKIRKPSRDMYVCSRHFKENDFFGGWLGTVLILGYMLIIIITFINF